MGTGSIRPLREPPLHVNGGKASAGNPFGSTGRLSLRPETSRLGAMTETQLPARRFTEKETDTILRRAAELQASGGVEATGERGLTITEMESIAREVGLDPGLIRRAALEMDQRKAARSSPFFGAPLRLSLERVIPGDLTDDGWGTMSMEFQRSFGPGHASQAGRMRTWSVIARGSEAASRSLSVSATVDQGRTVLRVDEPQTQLAGGLFGGLMGGLGGGGFGVAMGVGLGAFHSPLIAISLAVAAVAGSYALARTIFTRIVRRRSEELSGLLDRLAGPIPPSTRTDFPPAR